MRFILLLIFCAFGLTASAQWYRIDLSKKRHERFPPVAQVTDHSIKRLPVFTIARHTVQPLQLDRSDYNLEAAEGQITKIAQHHMRFREYAQASYSFNELAFLYLQQNRLTEAKWFLLQSNNISRSQNDHKLTISNLIGLATIKTQLGDLTQAQQDLAEAHELALIRGYRDDQIEIEKKLLILKQYKVQSPKPEVRYAEAPATTTKAG